MQGFKAYGAGGIILYPETITPQHVTNALTAELGVMFVRSCRSGGWLPTALMGSDDGLATAAKVKLLCGGLMGATIAWDDEGPGGTEDDEIAYCNAFSAAVVSEHAADAGYIGAGTRMTSATLYHSLQTSSYWKSCSQVPTPDVRGWCMIQSYPPNQIVCGHQVDIDKTQLDQLGECRLKWIISDPSPNA
jgi:hypothetical protein